MSVPPRLPPRVASLSVLAFVFVLLPGLLSLTGSQYYFSLAQSALIFVILAASLNLISGSAGLLSFAHAAFYGIGAYTAALMATKLGTPFYVNILPGGIMASLFGVLVALPIMRLTSIYFAVATLGIGQIFYIVMLNWYDVTNGAMGIRSIPLLGAFGYDWSGSLATYYVLAVVAVICVWAISRFTHSYYGNAIRALREDPDCAQAMGINVVRLKVEVFAASCFFAGVAGTLYAHTVSFISPDSFGFTDSILILACVVVGGLGSLPGAVVGAVLLVVAPELTRGFGDFRILVFGVLLYLSIMLMPRGLVGEVSALDLVRRQFHRSWPEGDGRGARGVGWR